MKTAFSHVSIGVLLLLSMALAGLALYGCQSSRPSTGPGAGQAPPPAWAQIPGIDLRRQSPALDSLTLQLLKTPTADANAILRVVFSPGQRIGKTFRIPSEHGDVTLRDDGKSPDDVAGDGKFAALVTVDAKRLTDAAARSVGHDAPPVFVNRVRIRQSKRAIVAPERILNHEEFSPLDMMMVPPPITTANSLMITDVAVVDDARATGMGKWSFGYLMQQLCANAVAAPGAPPITTDAFVRLWLMNYQFPQSPNSNVVVPRPGIQQVIDQWPRTMNGELDLAQSPFRLLAIVNRIDQSDNLVYGGGSGGEARFVFGSTNFPLFTVIFEYGIPVAGCQDLRNWGQQWANLTALTINSDAYRSALETITEQFVRSDTPFGAGRPNHSALDQLRTDEFSLAGPGPMGPAPWELREFHLVGVGLPNAGFLTQTVVRQTPITDNAGGPFNNTPQLGDFINANVSTILGQPLGVPGTDEVPLQFPVGTPFAAGSSLNPIGFIPPPPPPPTSVPGPANMFWNAPNINPPPVGTVSDLRSAFSLQTCSGCHGGETGTSSFLQIFNRNPGQPSQLSQFLTGFADPGYPDPAGSGQNRAYADLDRRNKFLGQLLVQECVLNFGHFPRSPRHPLPPPGSLEGLRTHMSH